MKLCNKRPCSPHPLYKILSDHFHDGSTDVLLYVINNDLVLLRNYPARLKDLTEHQGKIAAAEYRWYSCSLDRRPDPRIRFGLFFDFEFGNNYHIGIHYDTAVCKDITSHIRKDLHIGGQDIHSARDKGVTLFLDERAFGSKSCFRRLVGVRYKPQIL